MIEWLNPFEMILIKQLRSPTVHYKIIKHYYFSLLSFYCLKRIAILHVNIDKASNTYHLATLINTRCYCKKTKKLIGLLIPVKWKWQNRHIWQIFFNYKFLCVKTVTNTNKKAWWRHIDWKLNVKKNELRSSGGTLWLFKLCDKMWLTVCVANIAMPTSFHQCLGVKPCFEMKFCLKFRYKIYFSVVWKVVVQSTTFVIYCG